MVNLLSALPDTQLWRRLQREGRLLSEGSGNNSDCSLNFVPKMNPVRLVEGYKQVMRTIYNPAEYYGRALDCLKEVTQSGTGSRGTTLSEDIATLSRVILELGVRDPARLEFWRYFHRVLLLPRKKFPRAVMFAAMGYHLRKMTESYCG
jgi:hypothetical protein